MYVTIMSTWFTLSNYYMQQWCANIRNFESNRIVTCYSIRFETDATIRNFRIIIQPWSAGRLRRDLLYFASHKPMHSPDAEPSAAPSPPPRVFLPLPLPWVPWPCTHARSPVRACVLPAPGLDRGIWLRYNGGRQTQRMVSWALALLPVFLWIQL